ncbi:MAG: RHS repeat protein, partial [Candidatus Dormibacteraeota bacterium]|nr:RHS repeat protein [Candidatus Dormibacteraeota bacterium]
GYENWWSYVNQDLGAGGKASVNVANGNLVVQATDSTPVQGHGRFAYVLRRTYNSQDTGNLLTALPPAVYSLPDAAPIGAGWRLNVDELGDGIVDGAVADGILVPPLSGLANAALDVTLVDEDGTHHVFTPNGLAANGIPILGNNITPASDLLDLVPQALLRATSSDNICVDETFNSPAGVHLALWRYLEVTPASSSTPCTWASSNPPVVMGFGAMRPDRLRFEFSGTGQLLDETDGAGNDLRYAYRFQPTTSVALGNLLAVYEPRSCAATVNSTQDTVSLTPQGCRALTFSYPSSTETDVSDPGGRTTEYLRNPSNQLVEVKNVQAGSAYQYTYSTVAASCGSIYGQLCSASDLNLATSNTTSPCATTSSPQHITCFTYAAPASGLGLPQVSTITDRRGYSTAFTYTHATTVNACSTTTTDYVTADRSGERQRFECIDPAGSVGEIDQGNTSDTYQHQTLNFWDTGGQYTCVKPTSMTDHNLCRSFRLTLNGAQTAEDTSSTYNPEGQLLIQAKCQQASDPGANGTANTYPPQPCQAAPLYTTYGYQAEYTMGDGTQPASVEDTVAGSGADTEGARPTGHAGTLYVLSDKTQSVTPNGNAVGGSYVYFVTSYIVDNNQAATPDAVATAAACGPSSSVNGVPCATNPTAGGTIRSVFCPGTANNSGLVCETDAPSKITRYEYDSFGQKVAMVTPNAVASSQASGNSAPSGYMYVYYADSQLDLSRSVSAGGWLLATADPTGNFVADAYDQAGNLTRTWDRNATAAPNCTDSITNQACTPASFPNSISPSSNAASQYAETLHGSGARPYAAPWRFVLSQRDPLGFVTAYTVDGDGNQGTIRPQNGTLTNSSAYDIMQQFDAADELTSHLLPQEASGNHATFYSYDAFGNKATMTSPNGVLTAYQYDSVNRLTTTEFTRSAWPADTTTVPPACRESAAGDAPIPAGFILCFTRSSYDGVDNKTASSDGNAQVTSYVFDSLHRTALTIGPRQVNGAGTTTQTSYDADGNVRWVCSPREFTDPGHTSCSGAGPNPYSTQHVYDSLDMLRQTITYRIVGGVTQTQTTAYTYDADGNQMTVTDPNGHTTTTTYDVLDRKTLQRVPRDGGSSNVTQWFYDPAGNVTTLDQPDGPSTGSGADGNLVVDGSTNGASNPYVIPAGKNYTNVTLQNSAVVAAQPYDGSSDGSGIVQITASGTVSVCGTCQITVAGRGPAGGPGGLGGGRNCGLTTCDGPTAGAPGNGLGGGGGAATGTWDGGPGGGGGHATAGQTGTVPPYNALTASYIAGPAPGGGAYGSPSMAPADVSVSGMGSGGGGGGGDGGTSSCTCASGGNGGAGGGLVRIVANTVTLAGGIDASGAAGQSTVPNSLEAASGPGGGGSGGSIWLSAESITIQSGVGLVTTGGQGGSGANTTGFGLTVAGNGSGGYVRLDAAYLSNQGNVVAQSAQTTYHRYTDYKYDADNHLTDTVQGADNPVAKLAGLPSGDGGQNMRTRTLYDPEGRVSEQFDPRAFTASVTNPDPSFMVRTDYDYDERPAALWVPRYDASAHSDIGLSSTQTSQCPTGANPQVYPSSIGLCVTRVGYDYNGNRISLRLPTSNGSDNRYVIYSYTNDNLVGSISAPNPASNGSQETVQTTVYDGDGKVVGQTDALGSQQVTAYTPDELVQSVTNQPNGPL